MADPQAQGDAIMQYLAQEGARRQAAIQQYRRTSVDNSLGPVGDLLHWVWYGQKRGAGLGAVPGQFAHSIDPRSRAGLANLASLFAPGARGEGYGANPLPEDVLSEWQPAAHFKNYDHQTGGPLDRGISNEGPNRGAPGAGIRGLVRRAEGVNPLRQADPEKVAAAKHAIIERQVQAQLENHRAMQAVKMRRQVDARLGSAPMAGHVPQPHPEHDYFDAPQFEHVLDRPHADPHVRAGLDARQALVKHLMAQRYQAQLRMHNHLN